MKWIDYRQALGIGFNNKKCEEMFRNKIKTIFSIIEERVNIVENKKISMQYFKMVGEVPVRDGYYFSNVCYNICSEDTIIGLVSKMIAFINSCKKAGRTILSIDAKSLLFESLDELNIQFELYEDNDGIFLFPKGAKELDKEEVSITYEWLKKYPKAREAMTKALLLYSQGDNPSNIADSFRKALETFYQEFFGASSSLEKLKSDLGKYLKDKGVPKEITGNIETVLQLYTNFNNNYAKHHDKTSKDVLEFIMYQTGNLIRLIITLEK